MRVSVGNSECELFFGKGLVLVSLEAEPLVYGGDYPLKSRDNKFPKTRRIRLEGYICAGEVRQDDRCREVELRRVLLSRITSPGKDFFIRIGDRFADATAGELVLKRHTPFSGEETEHFTLTAVIRGGYFRSAMRTVKPRERIIGGLSLPFSTEGATAFGTCDGTSVIGVRNRGDVPVGFVAEFSPQGTVTSFSLRDTSTGKYISCSHSFGTGDVIRISTIRDDLRFSVLRGGKEINLTGYADAGSELFLLSYGDTVLEIGNGAKFTGNLSYREAFVTF